jgi:two-component system, OmpR family, response regulator
MVKWHVLVVDDDPQIGELLSDYLKQHGYRVTVARDGIDMRRKLKEKRVDLVVLDIMMPGEDGLSICRKLREEAEDLLIIMLSAMNEETDRIVGLEVGADDYISKPFSPRELLARIKTLERLTMGPVVEQRRKRQINRLPRFKFAKWILDQNKRQLLPVDGAAMPLSTGEYELLMAFLENSKRTLTRDQLLDITRGRQANPFDRTIDVQVARLRKKIEDNPKEPKLIITVRGGGYQLTVDVTPEEK